jgi:hypothetical protein
VIALSTTFAATSSAATQATAPTNTCPPTIEGSLVVGKSVRAGNGCWVSGATSFTYKWLRCTNQTAKTCTPISGATDPQYTLTQSDLNHSLVVLVTASNSSGSTGPVNSKPSDLVSAAAQPAFRAHPTISGKAQVGEALVAKPGTFNGGIPRKFTFQWQRCDQNGANCVNISGATSESYGVRTADVGKTLRVQIVASNDFGSATDTSDRSAVVQAIPQPVAVTTSMTGSRSVTTCCQTVRLSGMVSTHKAGETVLILAREFDALASHPLMNVTSDPTGAWTALVRPSVKTTYFAQAGSEPGPGLTVNVRPRVGLGVTGRFWSTKVTARDSFAGSLVLLQRRSGSRWLTVKRVVLNLGSAAHFKARLPRGRWTVRMVVPSSETGPGYLTGISRMAHVRSR